MVLAASALRIPAALTEADAHLGLANKLAAPFAQPRLLRLSRSRACEGPKYRVVGRPIPARSRPPDRAEARAALRPPAGRAGRPRLRRQPGRPRASTRPPYAAFADEGPAVLHLAGERDFAELDRRSRRDDYRLLAFTDEFGAALAAADLVVARAGGSVWEVAAAGQAGAARPVPARDRRPPDEERALLRAGRRRGRRPRGGARPPPAGRRALSATPSGSRAWARRCSPLAKPDAADVVAEELIALARA